MSVTIDDHTNEVISATKQALLRALVIIGDTAAGYAAELTPVKTSALRNSMTRRVDESKMRVSVGSDLEYAPYVELGTGKLYEPPASFIEFKAKKGRGLDKWFYKDEDGEWHVGLPRQGVHMVERAIKDHLDEYKEIIQTELSEVGK